MWSKLITRLQPSKKSKTFDENLAPARFSSVIQGQFRLLSKSRNFARNSTLNAQLLTVEQFDCALERSDRINVETPHDRGFVGVSSDTSKRFTPCARGRYADRQATAARMRGVSRQAITGLIQRGKLTTVVIDGHVFLLKKEIENFKPDIPGPRSKQAAKKQAHHRKSN